MDRITGEDFELTEAIKDEIHKKLEKIKEYTKNETNFSVFLTKESDHGFTVKINTHYSQQDLIGSSTDKDFYVALNKAKQNMIRQIVDLKEKKIHNRH